MNSSPPSWIWERRSQVGDPADRRRRRRHSEAFKADAVAARRQPGVSIAAIAMADIDSTGLCHVTARALEVSVSTQPGWLWSHSTCVRGWIRRWHAW